MNNKEYKAIAEIMKLDDLDIHRIIKAGHTTKDIAYYEGMNRAIQNTRSQLIRLADYFENEDINKAVTKSFEDNSKVCKKEFNREQFLKDCGVEK